MATVDSPKQFEAEADAENQRWTDEELELLRERRAKAAANQKSTVVDETGKEVEVSLDNVHDFIDEREPGEFYDSRTGNRLEQDENGQWQLWMEWTHGTMEFKGHEWEYRTPKALAAMFLGMASRRQSTNKKKLDAIIGYLEHTLSPRSFEQMMELAFDHDEDFDTADMAALVSKISSEGSARPTT